MLRIKQKEAKLSEGGKKKEKQYQRKRVGRTASDEAKHVFSFF